MQYEKFIILTDGITFEFFLYTLLFPSSLTGQLMLPIFFQSYHSEFDPTPQETTYFFMFHFTLILLSQPPNPQNAPPF